MHFLELLDASGVLSFLVEVTLKSTLILAAAGLAASLLKSASAALRHLVWSTALVMLLALPLFVAFTPSYDVPVLPSEVADAAQMQWDGDSPTTEMSATISLPVGTRDRGAEMIFPDGPKDAGSATSTDGSATASLSASSTVSSSSASSSSVFGWHTTLFLLWVIGCALVATRYVLGWTALRRIRRHTVPVADVRLRLLVKRTAGALGIGRRIRVLWGPTGSMPLTFGWVQPTVLLPEDAREWEAQRLVVVLKHELAHVKRFDCLVQGIVYVACTLYWFNPLVWIAATHSHREREMACDDYVLSTGSKGQEYAGHLLEIARSLNGPRLAGPTTIAMARRSELEGRLLAILSPNRKRGSATTRGVLGTFAVLGCLVMVVAALRPVAMKGDETSARVEMSADIPSEVEPSVPLVARIDVETPVKVRSELPIREIDEQYVAEASAIVEMAAATLEESLEKLIPRSVRLNGSIAGRIDHGLDFVANGRLEIVRADTIPLEQIRRLRNAGVDVEFIEELASLGYDRLTVDQLVSLSHAGIDREYIIRLRDAGYTDLSADDLIDLGFAGIDASDIETWARVGYTDLSSRELMKLAHSGIDPEAVQELVKLGYSGLTVSDLIRMGHANVDAEFVQRMREFGFDDLTPRELISLSHADVDAEFVHELREAGYSNLDSDELIRLSHADVDTDFIREMADLGLTDLGVDELVQLGHADVDAEFVAEMRATGYGNLDVSELVALSHADIDASFVRDLSRIGMTNLELSDLVRLGHADIDASWIRRMKESGYANLDVDDLIQMGFADVDPDYVAELARAGVKGLSPTELVQLSHAGIDADVISELYNAGMSNLSASDLIQLGFADVDGDYLEELASVGLTDLSVSDLVMLAHSDVDADDVRAMRELGIDTKDPAKIVQFKYMDVDPEYVQRMRRALERNR